MQVTLLLFLCSCNEMTCIGVGKKCFRCFNFFCFSNAFRKITCDLYLHCDKSVINHHFFCQEICSYSSFVLITELLIHILVHQRCLPNPVEKKQYLYPHLAGKNKTKLENQHIYLWLCRTMSHTKWNALRTLIMQAMTKFTFTLWNWNISHPQTFPSGKLIRDHGEMKGF